MTDDTHDSDPAADGSSDGVPTGDAPRIGATGRRIEDGEIGPWVDPEQHHGVRDDQRRHRADVGELRPRGPIMAVLHGYRVAANKLATVLGLISAFLIFPTVVISLVNVVLRRIGASQGRNLTSNWLIEAQWYLYTLIFVFGLAYILRDGINVRVDFWFGNLSSKTQSWIDLIGHFIGLIPFAYIGIKYSWPSVKLSWDAREQSPDAGGLARYPIKTALMMGFVFLLIQGIAEVIKNIEYLRGHEHRYADDAPALAAGQKYSVEEFDVQAAGVGLGRGDAE